MRRIRIAQLRSWLQKIINDEDAYIEATRKTESTQVRIARLNAATRREFAQHVLEALNGDVTMRLR